MRLDDANPERVETRSGERVRRRDSDGEESDVVGSNSGRRSKRRVVLDESSDDSDQEGARESAPKKGRSGPADAAALLRASGALHSRRRVVSEFLEVCAKLYADQTFKDRGALSLALEAATVLDALVPTDPCPARVVSRPSAARVFDAETAIRHLSQILWTRKDYEASRAATAAQLTCFELDSKQAGA